MNHYIFIHFGKCKLISHEIMIYHQANNFNLISHNLGSKIILDIYLYGLKKNVSSFYSPIF
jgi:hypothetical protein